MSKKLKNKVLVYVFVLLALCPFASLMAQKQALLADIKKSKAAYAVSDAITMDMMYKVYKNYTDKTPESSYPGFVKRKGKLFYNKMLNSETLNSNNISLSINSEDKLLIVAAAQNNKSALFNLPADTLLNLCKEVKLLSNANGSKTYEIVFGDLNIELEKLRISFDTKTWFMTQLVMYYKEPVTFDENANAEYFPDTPKEKPRVEINYTNTQLNPALTDADFSEKKFISLVNNKYQGVGAFKGYRIIDQSKH